MTLTGADTDELRSLATRFTAGASELQSLTAELGRALDAAADWQGPDATRCKQELGELARGRISGVADALETAGALLQREAADQDTASDTAAATTTAQRHPGLLGQLAAWGKATFGLSRVADKWRTLQLFFRGLGTSGFLVRTRAAIQAVEKVLGMSGDSGVKAVTTWLGRVLRTDLGAVAAVLRPWGKVVSRIVPPLSVALSIPDIVDKGGWTGWRGEVTRGLAVANAVAVTGLTIGAMTVGTAAMAASAPLLVGAAGVAVGLYGAWTVVNGVDKAIDTSPVLSGHRDRFLEAAGRRASGAWQGARSLLEVSSTFARGVLGPATAATTGAAR